MSDTAPDDAYPDAWRPPHLRRAEALAERAERAEGQRRQKQRDEFERRPSASPLVEANSISPNGFHLEGI